MPVACSEDLQRCIVWQSIYQEANPDEIAVSLYICERTVRRIISHFLANGVNIGRPRALTSLAETLFLTVIFENLGIYLHEVQRYLEKKPSMVKKKDQTPSFAMAERAAFTVCEEWDKAELIRGHALVSHKLYNGTRIKGFLP